MSQHNIDALIQHNAELLDENKSIRQHYAEKIKFLTGQKFELQKKISELGSRSTLRENTRESYLASINHLKEFVHYLSQSEDDLQKGDAATMLDQLNSIEIIVESNIL